MSVEIATKEDLQNFKAEILEQLQKLIANPKPSQEDNPQKWLKSHQVQRMLGISPGTLQNLRINGTIPYTKMGGVILYSLDEINLVLKHNKRNGHK
ncbi:MAG: helix-turn-helix domain-containing protein [Bacteroidia bacterium]